MFADDSTFFFTFTNGHDLYRLMSNCLSESTSWLRNKGFILKSSKTQSLLFSLSSTGFPQTNNEVTVRDNFRSKLIMESAHKSSL